MSDIPLSPVQSSNIRSVGYDAEKRIQRVRFASGATYDYRGVSADAHAAMLRADSIGSHHATHIKGRHEGKKVAA